MAASLASWGSWGWGAQPPTSEGGSMLSDSQDLIFSAPYQKMVKEMEVI
ncbi:MAG: hypothetical protein M0Q47_01900 [Methanothrix sp.]|nr:hypothetical protein [Methanothrix sp.]MCK9405155.1 hypothetical protein [Methanothrix sp.]